MNRRYTYYLLSYDSGEHVRLESQPEGWDVTKFNVVKDFTYFGLFKSISVEFNFVGDGFEFLQRHRLLYGVDSDVLLRVYDKGEFLFEGKINHANFGEDRDYRRFKVDIIQSNFVQDFQNREDKKLNVFNTTGLDQQLISPVQTHRATVRGRTIQRTSIFEGVVSFGGDELYHQVIPFALVSNDNPDVKENTAFELSDDIESLRTPDNAIFVNRSPINQTIALSWTLNYTTIWQGAVITPGAPYLRLIMRLMNDDNSVSSILFERLFNNTFGTFEDNYNSNVVVGPGQYVLFTLERLFSASLIPQPFSFMEGIYRTPIIYNTATMSVLQDSVYPDTEVDVILPFDLFNHLLAMLTGVENSLTSTVFGRQADGYDEDGKWAYLGITLGLLLRGGTIDDVQLVSSFRDAWKSYSSIIDLALIIDGDKVVIEEVSTVLNNELNVVLGEVSELVISPATDYLFNAVKAGYPKVEYEKENGRDEFNTEVLYTNALRASNTTLDLQSVYRADGRGIEEARRSPLTETGSQDTRYDDKIYFLDLVKDGDDLYTRRLEDIFLVEGIPSPETVINARIAPGQNMLRLGGRIAIPLFRKPNVYYFQSKDKGSVRVVTEEGESTDGENLILQRKPHFLPEERSFVCPMTIGAMFNLLKNPLGIISYTYKGEQFNDLLLEVDIERENAKAVWRMLGTKPTPVMVQDDIPNINAVKYGDGPDDFIKYGNEPEDVLIYAD